MKLNNTENKLIASLCRSSMTVESWDKRKFNAARSLVEKGLVYVRYEETSVVWNPRQTWKSCVVTSISIGLNDDALAEFALKNKTFL
jgi:hypothetical protein